MSAMLMVQNVVWVVVENGDMLLYGPNGEELPAQDSLIATADIADCVATAKVSFVCNIAGSKQEMMDKIQLLKTQKRDIDMDKFAVSRMQKLLKKSSFLRWLSGTQL